MRLHENRMQASNKSPGFKFHLKGICINWNNKTKTAMASVLLWIQEISFILVLIENTFMSSFSSKEKNPWCHFHR